MQPKISMTHIPRSIISLYEYKEDSPSPGVIVGSYKHLGTYFQLTPALKRAATLQQRNSHIQLRFVEYTTAFRTDK